MLSTSTPCLSAVGPVAIISLLLSNGLGNLIPGSEDNIEPNDPANPRAQHEYNIAAVQVPGAIMFRLDVYSVSPAMAAACRPA